MEEPMELIRYSPPSRYDVAPYGFVVKVMRDDELSSLWIQTSHDVEHPTWKTMGEFLEGIFLPHLTDPIFIHALLNLNEEKPNRDSVVNFIEHMQGSYECRNKHQT